MPAALAIALMSCAGSAATPGLAPSSPSAEADDPLRNPEATAQGYGTTMFVAERDASRVWAVVDGESNLLVDASAQAGIRSLLVLGVVSSLGASKGGACARWAGKLRRRRLCSSRDSFRVSV